MVVRADHGVIAVLGRGERPKLSTVAYALFGDEVRVSVNADRAKTAPAP